jgi:hypothetical protein
MVACIDPAVALPQSVLNFCIKKVAGKHLLPSRFINMADVALFSPGVGLNILAQVARKIEKNPEKSEHARRFNPPIDDFFRITCIIQMHFG